MATTPQTPNRAGRTSGHRDALDSAGKSWTVPSSAGATCTTPPPAINRRASRSRTPPVVDAAVASATARGPRRGATPRSLRAPGSCSRSRTRRAAEARPGPDPHPRARQGALGRPRRGEPRTRGRGVRLRAAAAPQGRVLGETSRPTSTATRSASRSASWPASRLQLSGDVPMWMFPLAIACGNAFILKPREGPVGLASLRAPARRGRAADGVFNVVPRRQGRGGRDPHASRHSGRELRGLDAGGASHLRRPRRAAGKRVQALAAPKTTWSCCRTRISILAADAA